MRRQGRGARAGPRRRSRWHAGPAPSRRGRGGTRPRRPATAPGGPPLVPAAASSSAYPSSSGTHRVTSTLLVRKTRRPPGRSSRAASATQRSGSHHTLAPYSLTTRSKEASGSGTSSALASTSGKVTPNVCWQRRAVSSWAGVRSTPTGRAPARASQAERYAVPQPSSTTSSPATSPRARTSRSGIWNRPQVISSAAQARSASASVNAALIWVHTDRLSSRSSCTPSR